MRMRDINPNYDEVHSWATWYLIANHIFVVVVVRCSWMKLHIMQSLGLRMVTTAWVGLSSLFIYSLATFDWAVYYRHMLKCVLRQYGYEHAIPRPLMSSEPTWLPLYHIYKPVWTDFKWCQILVKWTTQTMNRIAIYLVNLNLVHTTLTSFSGMIPITYLPSSQAHGRSWVCLSTHPQRSLSKLTWFTRSNSSVMCIKACLDTKLTSLLHKFTLNVYPITCKLMKRCLNFIKLKYNNVFCCIPKQTHVSNAIL